MRQRLSIIISIFLILFMAYGSAYAESVLYYADATAADQGVAGTRTIKGLMTAIGSTKDATIVLSHSSNSTNTTYAIGTTLTLTANITLKVERGALITIATGQTLTINGHFDSGLFKVFTCSGTGKVVFRDSAIKEAYPEWWETNTTPGTTDMSAALNAAITAHPVMYLRDNYSTGLITIPTTARKIYGTGTLIQAAVGAHIMVATSNVGPLIIDGIKFVGITGTTATSTDTAIRLISCENATVQNCYFTLLRSSAVYSVKSNHVRIIHNTIYKCNFGIRFAGGQYIKCDDNVLLETTCADFTIAIAFDTTNTELSNSYARYISVSNNTIRGYYDAQAILLHGGIKAVIKGNNIENAKQGISIAPYSAHAADDEVNDIEVSDNIFSGYTSIYVDLNDSSAFAISVSGASTNYAERVNIHDNIVYRANRSYSGAGTGYAGSGGIRLQYSNNSSVQNNLLIDCGYCGIGLGANFKASVRNNTIDNVIEIDSTKWGIYIWGALTDSDVSYNSIRGTITSNPTTFGIRDSLVGSHVRSWTRKNTFLNVTTPYSVPAAETLVVEGYLAAAKDDLTPSVLGVEVLKVTQSGAKTITNFDDGQYGQQFVLVTADANTTIKNNSTIVTGTGGDVALAAAGMSKRFTNIAGVWYMEQ
jgi:hypothetical protein